MKILAIGNSFSQDATRYLRPIARSAGHNVKAVNLYIGGCPLRDHAYHAREDKRSYEIQIDGEGFGFFTTIKEALLSDRWDIVTVQQASHESYDYGNYQPYLNELAAYVRTYAPDAKLWIQETWAYESASERIRSHGYETYAEMFADVKAAYAKAAAESGTDGIIPSGTLLLQLLENGVERVHRDTFHASLGLGRYAIALLWFALLCGGEVDQVTFNDFDEAIDEKERALAKRLVKELV